MISTLPALIFSYPVDPSPPQQRSASGVACTHDAAKTEAKSNLGLTDANYTEFDGGEVGAELVESMEAQRMKKKKKYNLRKSIAWDSAFFTSAASDNLTLENLEADLFGDIRASIQRFTKGSDVGNSTSEVVSLETEITSIPYGTSVFTGAVWLSTLIVTQILFTRNYTAIGYPGG